MHLQGGKQHTHNRPHTHTSCLKWGHFDHFKFIVHNGEHSLMFPTAIKERESSICSAWKSVSHISSATDWWLKRPGLCVFYCFTHVIIALLVSEVSFAFDSTVSEFMLPLSKSGSMQISWPGIKFESGLESDVTGASSSTSEGSGLFSGETTDSDGGRRAWGWERGPVLGLLLRVRFRFWSKPKLLSLGEELVRLFRESTSWDETGPTSWFKFLSRKWFATSGRTVKREEKYWS